jgi:hypothetical protein
MFPGVQLLHDRKVAVLKDLIRTVESGVLVQGQPVPQSCVVSFHVPRALQPAFVAASARFARNRVVFGDRVALALSITSCFPASVDLARVEVVFNVPSYNLCIEHEANGATSVAAQSPSLSTPHTIAPVKADLSLKPGVTCVLTVELPLDREPLVAHSPGVGPGVPSPHGA